MGCRTAELLVDEGIDRITRIGFGEHRTVQGTIPTLDDLLLTFTCTQLGENGSREFTFKSEVLFSSASCQLRYRQHKLGKSSALVAVTAMQLTRKKSTFSAVLRIWSFPRLEFDGDLIWFRSGRRGSG